MREDRLLARRMRAGDVRALRRVYLEYKDDLLTLATCLLADGAAAEDVLHDVFVALAADPTRRDIRRSLRGYLVAAVVNRVRDRRRRRAHRGRLHRDLSEQPPAAAAPTPTDPTVGLVARATEQTIGAALAALPHEQREVVVLYARGAMTFRQIARAQGIAPDTAKSRYRYGLDRLRSILARGAGA